MNAVVPFRVASAGHLAFDVLTFLARLMGVRIVGGRGSGKSTLIGLYMAFQDFCYGIPGFLFDPLGEASKHFLIAFSHLPPKQQEQLAHRLLYVDVSGHDAHVIALPLLTRFGNESWYNVAQPPLEVFSRVDADLGSAPIMGRNAITHAGTALGALLAASGGQLSDAPSVLNNLALWEGRLRETVHHHSELAPALDEVRQLIRNPQLTLSLRTKLDFFLDPNLRAVFGANAGLDWNNVLTERRYVLFDFGRIHSLEMRRLAMAWAWYSLVNFLQHRGSGHHLPLLSVYIDELPTMLSVNAAGRELFAHDLMSFMNFDMRNRRVMLTLAHQEDYQFRDAPALLSALSGLGTQIIGATTDFDTAQYRSRQYMDIELGEVKKREQVWGSVNGHPVVVDDRTVEYSMEEQIYRNSRQFRDLGQFEFLVKVARGEGDARGSLNTIRLPRLDYRRFPSVAQLEAAQSALLKLHGQAKTTIWAEIEARQPRVISQPTKQSSKQPHRGRRDHGHHPQPKRQPPAWGEKATSSTAHTARLTPSARVSPDGS